MMSDLLYAVMSLMDGITIFMFAFACFKVNLKDYWKEIVMTNILISIGTFLLKDNEYILGFVPVLCFVSLVASLTFYFRIKWRSSLKLAAYGFAAQIISQLSIALIFMLIDKITFAEASQAYGTFIQLIGNVFIITLTMILKQKRIWFTTMSHDYNFKIKINRINIYSILVSIVIIVLLYNVNSVDNIYLALCFWGICLLNLMYIDIKKERNESYD
ncbi:hypothetical protein [Paenibacillus silvae]|uniref:Uncharacterized protein n=1 Tax=Paenibacillus silvae TaxID=1325358 RepID=A0A2W6NQ84_9BACL|nr:hypothetical protein [Paenibacillus silvae]PZT57428.1 hypothetical protein DN757_01880 [Paenibacillus silvae]